MPENGALLLEVRDATKRFGGLVACNGMQLTVRAGEVLALIGPNGAGKSTMFNLISGVTPLTTGEILFLGSRIDGMTSRAIAKRGMSRSFQHVRLLPTMSVLENAAIGAHMRGSKGVLPGALHIERTEESRLLAEAARQIQRVGPPMATSNYPTFGRLKLPQAGRTNYQFFVDAFASRAAASLSR